MNVTILAFGIMAGVSILFAAATVGRELNIKLPTLTQTGDSSLSRHSVTWLAVTALIAAVLICLL